MSAGARVCGIVLVLVLTVIAGLAVEAPAQDAKFRTYNKNPIVISGQIRLAREQEQRAMELIAAAAGDPATLEKTKATVYDAYVLIRAAIGGVRMQRDSKFPDPMLPAQIDLMEKARVDLRNCLADLDRVRLGQIKHLETARASLESSMATLNSVALLLP
jgi:hypothetical protein